MALSRLGLLTVFELLLLSCAQPRELAGRSADTPPAPERGKFVDSATSGSGVRPEPPSIQETESSLSEVIQPKEGPIFLTEDVLPPRRIVGDALDLSTGACSPPWPPVIILQTVIDERGNLQNIEFLKGPPSDCAEKVIRETLSTWKFEPARLDGEPVAVYFHLSVHIHFQ